MEKAISTPIPATQPIRNLRWWIAGLLAMATFLSYLDRQSFSLVQGEIRKEIPISTEQFARLTSLFLLAYAIMYAGGGRIMDWLGTRVGYAVMIVFWSAANFATGLVSSVFGLGTCRFLLGMGEGGGFPGSGKAVAEWFPPRERSIAFGIFNTGGGFGAVIAPPLIAYIVTQSSWRWVFFITGVIGFFWAMFWLKLYQPPATNKHISAEEADLLKRELPAPSVTKERVRWLELFKHREVLGLMGAKFLTDSAWYFYGFWLPKYLADARGLDIKAIGGSAWIPYAAGAIGSFGGGYLGAYMIRRGLTLDRSRKTALCIPAFLMPCVLFITNAETSVALAFFSLAMFSHQFWSANIQTIPADLFPSRVIGSVEGLLGSAGAFGGMLFGLLVGYLVETSGYGIPFLIAGVMHPIGFFLILATVKKIGPLRESTA